MRLLLLVLLACFCGSAMAQKWTPPENPDPSEILDEARRDARAGRYEAALVKHVWFHEHALEIDPPLYGVRLSFALADWLELADKYPPALQKLKEVRDQALEELLKGERVRENFHDMKAINERLREESRTIEAFERLDKEKPELAKEVLRLARPALVRAKRFVLLEKYVDPDRDFREAIETYREMTESESNSLFPNRVRGFAERRLTGDAATLIAILVVNDRKAEAERIAEAFKMEWDDAAFHAAIDKALAGIFPEPWP